MSPALRNVLYPLLVLVPIGVLVYAGGLRGPFFGDDLNSIVDNPNIESWGTAFSAPDLSTVSGRPIVCFSLAVNYAVGGREVVGYHVLNIGLHVLCALLLCALLRRTLESARVASAPGLALAITLLWMVHPLQTETVTWVIQRTELLVSLFYLTTLYCAIRGWTSDRSWPWYAAAVVACGLGMGSKEVMVSAPLMVLLYDRGLVAGSFAGALRRRWPLYVGLAATWSILIVILVSAPRGNTVGFGHGVTPIAYLYTQAEVLGHYLRLSFWPVPFAVAYDWPIREALWPNPLPSLLPGLLIVGLAAATIVALVRRHPLGLAGALFFMILAPSSSIVPIVTEVAAERRMYLPLVSVAAVCVLAVRLGLARLASPRAACASGVVLVVAAAGALSWRSLDRIRDYETVERIWRANHTVFPDRYQSNSGLGFALASEGRFEEAVPYLRNAVEIHAENVFARQNLALACARTGRHEEAVGHFRVAIALRPGVPSHHHNVGIACEQLGDLAQAAFHLREADRLRPEHPPTLLTLASVLTRDPTSVVFDPGEAMGLAVRAANGFGAAGRYEDAIDAAELGIRAAEVAGRDDLVERLRAAIRDFRARETSG